MKWIRTKVRFYALIDVLLVFQEKMQNEIIKCYNTDMKIKIILKSIT